MKPLLTASVISFALIGSQAVAFGPTMDSLTRDLSFPEPVSQPVTKDAPQTDK